MVSLWSRSAQTRMMAGTILLLDYREVELEFGMSFAFGPLIKTMQYRVVCWVRCKLCGR
jgi:hypothetical protein